MSKKKKRNRKKRKQVFQVKERKMTTTAKYFIGTDFCSICNGVCWNKNDNFKTQMAARKMFGIIPNKCVNSSIGPVCPNIH